MGRNKSRLERVGGLCNTRVRKLRLLWYFTVKQTLQLNLWAWKPNTSLISQ
jgi:hypothetical protein